MIKVLLLALSLLLSSFLEKSGPIEPGKGCILLTFDGYNCEEPLEHYYHIISYPSPQETRTEIQRQVGSYFKDWDVTITTEDSVFYTFPKDHRIRVVITNLLLDNGATYGQAPQVNALRLGDTTAAVVSAIGCGFDNYLIAVTVAHEVGHCLGLEHQSDWQYGDKVNEYGIGDGRIIPIMGGASESDMAFWIVGCNRENEEQDDTLMISKIFRRLTPNELQNILK